MKQRKDSPSTILLKSSSEWQSLILSLDRPPPGAAALQTNNLPPQTPSSTRGEKTKIKKSPPLTFIPLSDLFLISHISTSNFVITYTLYCLRSSFSQCSSDEILFLISIRCKDLIEPNSVVGLTANRGRWFTSPALAWSQLPRNISLEPHTSGEERDCQSSRVSQPLRCNWLPRTQGIINNTLWVCEESVHNQWVKLQDSNFMTLCERL